MSANKRHHYVPQFYLRRFSDADGRQIGLYNVPSSRFVARASLKDQAYANRFYGEDGELEHALSRFEGNAARTIAEVLDYDRLPQRFSAAHQTLAHFALLQFTRTRQAEAETGEMADMLAKIFVRSRTSDPDIIEGLNHIRLKLNNGILLSMRAALTGLSLIMDLSYKLVRNSSSHPFIISDHPVILHNQLYQDDALPPPRGFVNVGLQILVPLSPTRLLLFYDGDAYSVGRKASNFVDVRSSESVTSINRFQWLSALGNVYFHPEAARALIQDEAETAIPDRPVKRVEMHERFREADDGSIRLRLDPRRLVGRSKLILPGSRPVYRPSPLVEFELSPIRHPEWTEYVRQLTDQLHKKRITLGEFQRLTAMVPKSRRKRAA